jgi:prevent-host-death family protein
MPIRQPVGIVRSDAPAPFTGLLHVSATEARINLGSLMNMLRSGHDPIVVERYGRPVAVLMHFDDYQRRRSGADLGQLKRQMTG